jgi:hypothetical protein
MRWAADVDVSVFFLRLAEADTAARSAYEATAPAWPDGPPLTLLASLMAKAVVAQVEADLSARWGAVLAIAEEALAESDEQTKDIVATGFLEALLGEAIRRNVGTEVLRTQLGDLSREFVQGWEALEVEG